MKYKLLTLLMVLMLALSLAACGDQNDASNSTETPDQSVVEKETPNEEASKETVDTNLEGKALLNALSNDRPERLLIKSEMTAFGTTTQVTTYFDGAKSRTEMDVPDMAKSILIHLPDEGVMYSYVYGQSNGVKMTGADTTYAEEMGLMVDRSMFTEIVNQASNDMIARADTLDGKDVIYIEAKQSDEELGDVLVKMWYSDQYATPLKYEVILGETVMAELTVTEITDGVSIDPSLFQPPTDVTFNEVDMKTMMEN